MDAAIDPLKTRCLPNSPCLHFPRGLVEWDTRIREAWHASPNEHSGAVESLRWLVEHPLGIALLSVIAGFIFYRCFLIPQWPGLRRAFEWIAIFAIGMGLSDKISVGLKILIGRLKPHVTFYNPRVYPALSFPSSHAFNTAFLCAFFFFQCLKLEERSTGSRRNFGAFLVLFMIFISLSRLVLGEHYPLDVFAGTCFGLSFAWIYSALVSRLRSTKP